MSGANGEASVNLPIGDPLVKTEPSEAAVPDSSGTTIDGLPVTGEEPANVLIPKKKRARRSPSSDEDLPPPPPPMKTMRLERELVPDGQTLEWNILDDAREKGMISEWAPVEEERDVTVDGGMDVDGQGPAPSDGPAAGLLGPGGIDEDAEAIARRLEEKYAEPKKKKKVKVSLSRCYQAEGLTSRQTKRPVDYDLEDPFIDDSELLIDAPTHVGRPKKEGFFVHSGPLELLEE